MEVISELEKSSFSGMVEGREDGNHGGNHTGAEWSMCLWGQRTQLGKSAPPPKGNIEMLGDKWSRKI